MGFLRRSKSMFKRNSATKKKAKGINDSDRTDSTCKMDLEENLTLSDHSLDECLHTCQGARDFLDSSEHCHLSHRQVHSTRPNVVSFRDEELGLTPRHVVTQIHYRPRTCEEEKDELYYNRNDFHIFEQEDMFEQIEREIQDIECMSKLHSTDSRSQCDLIVEKVVDEKRILELMRRAEMHF